MSSRSIAQQSYGGINYMLWFSHPFSHVGWPIFHVIFFLVYFLSLSSFFFLSVFFFFFFFCTRWNSYCSNSIKKNEREVYFLTLHVWKYLYYSIIAISTRLDRNKFPSECYRHSSKGVCFQSDYWETCCHLQPLFFVQVYSFPHFWSLYK